MNELKKYNLYESICKKYELDKTQEFWEPNGYINVTFLKNLPFALLLGYGIFEIVGQLKAHTFMELDNLHDDVFYKKQKEEYNKAWASVEPNIPF